MTVDFLLFPLSLEILKGLFLSACTLGIAWFLSVEETRFYTAGWQGFTVSVKRISFCLCLFLSLVALSVTIRYFLLYHTMRQEIQLVYFG